MPPETNSNETGSMKKNQRAKDENHTLKQEIRDHDNARSFGLPLEGVRVLALEQLQALPVATQMLVRFGAEVVKVEPPGTGESGRQSLPAIKDRSGRDAGITFLRYGSGKKSITINLKSSEGVKLFLSLVPSFDIVCENLGPGRADKLGIGFDAVAAANPQVIYLSITGFGNDGKSPYAKWPAFAGVAEAMSGAYEWSRRPHQPPVMYPLGGVGDTATGLYGLIGLLAALRQRDRTGHAQYVDVAMLDSMIAMCDHIPSYWSLGSRPKPDEKKRSPLLASGFRARDGWFVLHIGRTYQFERLAKILGRSEWLVDERLANPWGWTDQLETILRPAIEEWASTKSKFEAARIFAEDGVAAAPCSTPEDLMSDPHVIARKMLIEIPRCDGITAPFVTAGNPIKMSCIEDTDEAPLYPSLGEHTVTLLDEILGISSTDIDQLRLAGAI